MKIRKYLMLAALIPIVCMAEFKSGNSLKNDCESSSTVNEGVCLGYILGVADAYSKQKICIPTGVTAGQLESITKIL